MSYLHSLIEQSDGAGNVTLTGVSAFDRLPIEVTVKEVDLIRYKNGELAQHCFPYLSEHEREMIISGLTSKEWARLFGRK